MRRATRHWLLAVVALLSLAAAFPLLQANASRQQAVWEAGCVGSGGSVSTLPARRDNPLVVQSTRPTYECRSAAGVLVSVRD
jgi:hypothetical protein